MRGELQRRIAKLERERSPKGGGLHVVECRDGAKFDPAAFLRSEGVQTTPRDLIVCIRRFGPSKDLPRIVPA